MRDDSHTPMNGFLRDALIKHYRQICHILANVGPAELGAIIIGQYVLNSGNLIWIIRRSEYNNDNESQISKHIFKVVDLNKQLSKFKLTTESCRDRSSLCGSERYINDSIASLTLEHQRTCNTQNVKQYY